MSLRRVNVKSAPALLPTPAAAGGISPDAYTRWRATTLGAVTEALEQGRVFELVGPVDGKRVLDLGSGDGRPTAALPPRGALAVGIDIDRSMLLAATAQPEDVHPRSAEFVRGRLEQLPFLDASFDVVVAVTVLCLVPDQTVAVREAVYYAPLGLLAKRLARLDRWIGPVTTVGAAFITVVATKGDVPAQR
jgi:SAM-dependent methyltransferase